MKTCLPAVATALLLGFTTARSAEDGFVPLFNGKDLTGWTAAKEKPESFTVKDGELIVKGGRSHLFYTGDVNGGKFKNFELKLKIKTLKGANSGVYFHTQYQDTDWPKAGFEAQVNSTHKDPKKTGSLYGVVNILALEPGQAEPKGGTHLKRDKAPSTDGEWFDYHITVKDKTVTIKVNGETTVEWTQPDGFSDPSFPGRKIGEGTFGIQAHDPDSEIHYQAISVKVLP